jgi:hypothetical protein
VKHEKHDNPMKSSETPKRWMEWDRARHLKKGAISYQALYNNPSVS